MDRLLIKLVAFILFLFSALAFATEGKSLKLYRNTEVVKKEIIHVHNAFVESITEGEIPDTFRFNDIEIKNITEFTWEITNNTPIPSKYFPVKLKKLFASISFTCGSARSAPSVSFTNEAKNIPMKINLRVPYFKLKIFCPFHFFHADCAESLILYHIW